MRIVNPVWGEQSTESRHKHQTTVIVDSLGELGDLVRRVTEPKIVCAM